MKYYVIINGNSSLDIQGLAIESLPNISKPLIRTTREEIDGRDGDIITKLGYSAYDKTLNIGLWGNYDINEVIAFFNEDGVITFSNEPDKYYKFHILNRIDFVNQLEKFKKASITIHCQPFKYKEQEAKVIEEEAHTTSGTSFNLSDTLEAPLEIDLKGNTSQTGTPTPTSPIHVNVVSGDNDIIICKDNLFDKSKITANSALTAEGGITSNNSYSVSTYIRVRPNTTYTFKANSNEFFGICTYNESKTFIVRSFGTGNTDYRIFTAGNNVAYIRTQCLNTNVDNFQMVLGNQIPSTYEAYNGNTYNIDLPVENLINVNSIYTTSTPPALTTNYEDGIATLSWTAGFNFYFANNENNVFSNLNTNETYTLSFEHKGDALYLRTDEGNTNRVATNVDSDYTKYSYTFTGLNEVRIKFIRQAYTNGTANLKNVMLELGSKSNTYIPFGTTPIELNKIGTYQDYIYKENDKWYLHKEIGKKIWDNTQYWYNYANPDGMMRYYTPDGDFPAKANLGYSTHFVLGDYNDRNKTGQVNKFFIGGNNVFQIVSDILNTNDFKDMLEEKKPVVYYALSSATNTEITYTPLIEQLNTLEEAQSYEGTTNINQVNNDLPFIIDLTYYTGDTSITITNDGNIYSKPLLELKGTGNINIYLNGIQVFVVSLNNEIIYIDTDKMEAYYQGTLKNRQVVGDYNNFKLQSGNNTIQVDGGYVEYLKITNYSRWV